MKNTKPRGGTSPAPDTASSEAFLMVENLTYSYKAGKSAHKDDKREGRALALDGASFYVRHGEFVGLVGPNGSGKSTALKSICRALMPQGGKILLEGENILSMPYRKIASKMAAVGQESAVFFDFTVEEIVAMGRYHKKKLFDIETAEDRRAVQSALEQLQMESLSDRRYMSLSGGEKQRALIARALSQEAAFFVLDEPTNHLDISSQINLFDFIKSLNVTVLAAFHDLNMAALYCDRLYVLQNGKIRLEGSAAEVLTEENILAVYGVRSTVTINPLTGKPYIAFLPSAVNL